MKNVRYSSSGIPYKRVKVNSTSREICHTMSLVLINFEKGFRNTSGKKDDYVYYFERCGWGRKQERGESKNDNLLCFFD